MCLISKQKCFIKGFLPSSQSGMAFKYQRGLSSKLQLLQGELSVRKSSSGRSVFVAWHRDWQNPSDRNEPLGKTLPAGCGSHHSALCVVGNCQSEEAVCRAAF